MADTNVRREQITEDDVFRIECAVENMRLADATPEQIETRFRLAYKLSEIAKKLSATLRTPTSTREEDAAIGWKACRRQVFAMCEQTEETAGDNDFDRARAYEAKHIAKAMNSFGPEDCDELAAALATAAGAQRDVQYVAAQEGPDDDLYVGRRINEAFARSMWAQQQPLRQDALETVCEWIANGGSPKAQEGGREVGRHELVVDGRVVFRNMADDATFDQFRDALAVGKLTPVDQMAFDNLLHDRLEAREGGEAAISLAHEIWAAAQLTPGETILDGVNRITDLLSSPASDPKEEGGEAVAWLVSAGGGYERHVIFDQRDVQQMECELRSNGWEDVQVRALGVIEPRPAAPDGVDRRVRFEAWYLKGVMVFEFGSLRARQACRALRAVADAPYDVLRLLAIELDLEPGDSESMAFLIDALTESARKVELAAETTAKDPTP